ncbi:Fe2OG dioxygenase domain-containing protein [Mycena venus]|uniref:Fe2OG dioxygenase domain-containing protein n=1 Tax=Mycena venus TaxID=2733690 RepID=A0A8H7CI78_9AGAR|nr:Fe2OG dioxygenase domain-containing protein [Mycena venus]
MGKKDKSTKPVPASNGTQTSVVFPDISPKSELECRVLLENQIIVIDDIFSPPECKSFVKFIESLPLELTPPKKRGEAERHNHRYSITSVEFAKRLYAIFAPYLPEFLPSKTGRANVGAARAAHSFNSNIRVYKYTPEQYFGPHYDDDCRDAMTGAKSEWTLLIYLTGYEDGVEGGETLFYQNDKDTSRDVIKAPLTRGTALLHRHGRECMLHEGSQVVRGVKVCPPVRCNVHVKYISCTVDLCRGLAC